MRVLLVNPGMDMEKLGRFAGLMDAMPVLGLAYLAAVCESGGHDLRVIDAFAQPMAPRDIAAAAASFGAEVIGVPVLTPTATGFVALAAALRLACPRAVVVAGNIHADLFAASLIGGGHADVVVHGEGEVTFAALLEVLGSERDDAALAGVEGISFRARDGEVRRNPDRPRIADLDSLPWPAWHKLPYARYGLLPLADVARPTLAMAASRGCPYRCDFCSLVHAGSNYRRRDPRAVVDELQALRDRFGARQVGFVDPIFPMSKGMLVSFCEEVMRRGLQRELVWVSETRVDRLDREGLRLMRAAGCRRLLLGIESGVDDLLEGVNKRFDTEQVTRAVRLCREEGVETIGLFMLGLPGETEAMTRQTIRFASEVGLDFAKFAITVPFPGSKLYDQLKAAGQLDREDWENFTTFQPDPDLLPPVPRGVDNRTLIRLQRAGTAAFYLRPRMVWHHLAHVRTLRPAQIARGLLSVA